MKTLKLILGASLLSLVTYSCSTERDEDTKTISNAPSVNLKTLKINNNKASMAKSGDTIVTPIKSNQIIAEDAASPISPNEGGDPTTITPPKR